MTFNEFKTKISALSTIKSKSQGKTYCDIHIIGDYVHFRRLDAINSSKVEAIDFQKLFDFYKNGKINTTTAKLFKLGGKQSPSVAIVNAIKNFTELVSDSI